MTFSEFNPFVRYARDLNLNKNTEFDEVVPLDARLFYVVDGNGKIKVKGMDYEMTPHSLVIINSGVPYRIMTPEVSVDYIAINFDYTKSASDLFVPVSPVTKSNYKKEMLINFHTVDDASSLSEVLYIKKIEALQKKLNSVVLEFTQKLLYHEEKCSHLLAECITDSLRFIKMENLAVKSESSNQIISYIHSHYSENLTNKLLGKLFGYHPNYISFLIKQISGMSMHRYIIHVRLMKAVDYLENTSLSVNEIAEAIGFCDSAYFSNYFKKYFGISPKKYRNV